MKRRLWLLGTGAAAALVVGWSVLPQRQRLGRGHLMQARDGEFALNGWIKIAADGSVVLAMPRSEMGQGVYTALPMLAAEELDVSLGAVRIEQAGSDTIYGNVAMIVSRLPFVHPSQYEGDDGPGHVKAARWLAAKVGRELGINATGGSSSIEDAWSVVREAAATARASLLGAASLQWKLPMEELTVSAGVVTHASGRSAGYGELARFAAATPPGKVQLKARKDWKLIGRPVARLDLPAKVDGTARFGLDVRLPGMKYAVVRMCPMLGGSPGRIRADQALALPGAQRLVLLRGEAGTTAGFAVVGTSYWHAWRAAQAVEVEWQPPPGTLLDSDQIQRDLTAAVASGPGLAFHARGDVSSVRPARQVQAWYSAPYLAHATLEPMNCTARVAGGKVEVWAPTQVPQLAQAVAARVAGVDFDAVSIHVTLLGGGFGRRLEVDYVALAVRVAMDCGEAAVQVAWPREEDMTHDFYRPMHVARLSAGLDAAGKVVRLEIKSAGDAISPRWIERTLPALAVPFDWPDKTGPEGLFDLPYAIAHQRMEHVPTRMGVPVGYWRSVGHSHNAFFSESFIDELAHAAGHDPLDFRRAHLAGAPRHLAVLELAALKSGWGSAQLPGRARGVALHESFGTVVAQVVDISLGATGLRLHRVVCAVDCGTVVHPGIVAQQMEGAVIFALTAALHGRIDIRGAAVQQRQFGDYPMVDLARAPRVETWLVPSERAPAGVGEPGVPPLAPALGNALYALTGIRQRSLPFAL